MTKRDTERHGHDMQWFIDRDGDVAVQISEALQPMTVVYLAPIDVLRMMARLLDVEVGEFKMDLVYMYGGAMDDTFAEGGN